MGSCSFGVALHFVVTTLDVLLFLVSAGRAQDWLHPPIQGDPHRQR